MRVSRYALVGSLAAIGLITAAAAEETITFQQVLRDPGNLELNIAYAQERAEAGDLLAAAHTLERVLIAQPNWDKARLLYAGVLYQLGDYDGAKREAELLEGRDLSESALAEVAKFKSRAERRTSKTHVSGRFSVGLGYDDNAGAQLVEDTANLGSGSLFEAVDQYSVILRGRLKVERELSEASDLTGFAEANLMYKRFEDDDFDGYLIADGKAGIAGEFGRLDWRTNLSLRDITIGGDNYLTEFGGQVRLNREITPKTTVSVLLGAHDQSYSNVFGTGDTSELRDGERYDLRAAVSHAFSSRTRLTIGADYRDKSAEIDDFAYEFVGASGGLDFFWPNASYIDTTLIYRDYEYDGGRADEFLYGRAALGIPLTALGGSAALEPFTLEGAVSYSDRQSNQDVYDFDNTGAEVRVIYRF